jgi:hypothetical protein
VAAVTVGGLRLASMMAQLGEHDGHASMPACAVWDQEECEGCRASWRASAKSKDRLLLTCLTEQSWRSMHACVNMHVVCM